MKKMFNINYTGPKALKKKQTYCKWMVGQSKRISLAITFFFVS